MSFPIAWIHRYWLHLETEDLSSTYTRLLSIVLQVRTIAVHETIVIDKDLSVTAYYAGHVLGATMFLVRSGSESVFYTGDYNMTPDR